jgi:CheY-like chemotaxis protein
MPNGRKKGLDQYTMNWIQRHKAKGTIIKVPMSKGRRQFLRQIFESFDTDGGGDIDFNEFKSAVQFVAPDLPFMKILNLFKELDCDDGGTIDFDEFCAGMSNKDAEEKDARAGKSASSQKTSVRDMALNHQREVQLANINSHNVRNAIGSFRALFKTHALSFPSTIELDQEEAMTETEQHMDFMRRRRRGSEKTSRRSKMCIIGISNDMNFSRDVFLEEQDFDDILPKPFTSINFNVSIQKINSLNPLEMLHTDRGLKILLADISPMAARVHSKVLSLMGHDVHIVEPEEVVEDRMIGSDFQLLVIDARMLNVLSQKPVVRHLRDYETEKLRNETIEAKRRSDESKTQQKRLLDHMVELIDAGISPFEETYLPENKSTKYLQGIKLKAYQDYSSATSEIYDSFSTISELTLDDMSVGSCSSFGIGLANQLGPQSLLSEGHLHLAQKSTIRSSPEPFRPMSRSRGTKTLPNTPIMLRPNTRQSLSFTASEVERRHLVHSTSSLLPSPVKLYSSPTKQHFVMKSSSSSPTLPYL